MCVLEVLKSLPPASEEDRRRWAELGFTHKLLDSRLGTTRRGQRRKIKKPESSDFRLIESIRCDVSPYKSRHPNFDQAFEKEFGLYRQLHCRDAEFCAEEEA
jgi:hypothetical protein